MSRVDRHATEPHPTRRAALKLAAGWCLAGAAQAHSPLGLLDTPAPAPGLWLTLHDGRRAFLPDLLQGRVTALQLMFTSCSAVCPLQGAVFAALQDKLKGKTATATATPQLLSISIDPLSDDARALSTWRARFGAGPAWLAGAPPARHAEVMLDFVDGRTSRGGAAADRHSAQVYLLDARGRLRYRCAELASADDIAVGIRSLARLG